LAAAVRNPDSADAQTQIWRNGNVDGVATGGDTLLPQGVYLRNDITGRDPAGWSLTGILYADEYYESISEFKSAWNSTDFKKMAVNYPGKWIATGQAGEQMPLDTKLPPQQVQIGGEQRFKVDEQQKYVEWMDFTFFVS
jgi:primary-amine oxidase